MSGIIGTSKSKSGVVGISQDTAKVWVNLDGTGTIAIKSSFNVSSITDVTTGVYTVTFATPMANADYASGGSSVDCNRISVLIFGD